MVMEEEFEKEKMKMEVYMKEMQLIRKIV